MAPVSMHQRKKVLGRALGGVLVRMPGIDVSLLALVEGPVGHGGPGEGDVRLGDLLSNLAGRGSSEQPGFGLLPAGVVNQRATSRELEQSNLTGNSTNAES